MLASLGAQTADADALVRWVYNSEPFKAKLVERFGPGVLDRAGSVDRQSLASIVFNDRQDLLDLENLVHPRVMDEIADIIEAYRRDPERSPVLAIEVQLLFEAGADAMVDRVLVVTAPAPVRRKRLADRGWDEERIAAVERSQMPQSDKESRADYVIPAGGTVEETSELVGSLWRTRLAVGAGSP